MFLFTLRNLCCGWAGWCEAAAARLRPPALTASRLVTRPAIFSLLGSGPVRARLYLVLHTINRRSCTITEKAPTRAFSWLKAATIPLSHIRIY